MQLGDCEFYVLRWISHFLRDGSASFVEMGSGKVVGLHWDVAEFLCSQGVVTVDTDALTVNLTEKGLHLVADHLAEIHHDELIGDDSREFLVSCLELDAKNNWVEFTTVPQPTPYQSFHSFNFEIEILIRLSTTCCIEVEGIYPDVRLRVTDKGVRLSRKEIKTL